MIGTTWFNHWKWGARGERNGEPDHKSHVLYYSNRGTTEYDVNLEYDVNNSALEKPPWHH